MDTPNETAENKKPATNTTTGLKPVITTKQDPLSCIDADVMEFYLLPKMMDRPRDLLNLFPASPYSEQIAKDLLTSSRWVKQAVDNAGMSNHFRNTDEVEEFKAAWTPWQFAAETFYDKIYKYNNDDYTSSTFPFLNPTSLAPFFGTELKNKLWIQQVLSSRAPPNPRNPERPILFTNPNRFINKEARLVVGLFPETPQHWAEVKQLGREARYGVVAKAQNHDWSKTKIFDALDQWLTQVPNLNALHFAPLDLNLVRVRPLPYLQNLVYLTLSSTNVLGTCFMFQNYWNHLSTLDVSTFQSFLDHYDYKEKAPSSFPKLQRLSIYVDNWTQAKKLKQWKCSLKEMELFYRTGSDLQAGLQILSYFSRTLLLARVAEQDFNPISGSLGKPLEWEDKPIGDPKNIGDPNNIAADTNHNRLPKLRALLLKFMYNVDCVCPVRSLASSLAYLQITVARPNAHRTTSHTPIVLNQRIWTKMSALLEIQIQEEIFPRGSDVSDAPLRLI